MFCSPREIGRTHLLTPISTLSLHDALPIFFTNGLGFVTQAWEAHNGSYNVTRYTPDVLGNVLFATGDRKNTPLNSDLHSFPTRRSSDLLHERLGIRHPGVGSP